MSTVENGVIRQVSVSQVESFDHAQRGGCELKWWLERVKGLRPEQSGAQTDGDKGHALLATYLATGQEPEGRVKMGTAVRAVIAKGKLPTPGADLLIEWRFSGQPKNDPVKVKPDGSPAWLPLDTTKTLWLGGVPWEGFIDCAHRRTDVPLVLDHKFSADIQTYAKKGEDLIKTVQMPIYVLALDRRPEFAGADRWAIAHHNVARSGSESFTRGAVVTRDQVLERKADIKATVERMKVIATATRQEDVPWNLKSCDAWNGCPHQSRCTRFKEKNKVQLTAEEQALFADMETADPAPKEEPRDEIAEMEAKLAAAKAAKAKPAELPPPPTPKPAPLIMPECKDCGTDLNPDNASKLKTGEWAHVGCPAKKPAVTASVEEPAKRTRRTKEQMAADAAASATPAIQRYAQGESAEEIAKSLGVTASSVAAAITTATPAPRVQIPDSTAPTGITIRIEVSPETIATLRSILGK